MQGPKRRSYGGLDEPGEATGGGPSVRETSVISRKELARELRRAAYQRAKQARAADPRHQAMKEAAKQRRREMYQQGKARQKARDAEIEAKAKERAAAEREAAQRQLAERVRGAVQSGAVQSGALQRGVVHRGAFQLVPGAPTSTPAPAAATTGPSLARDIERALQCSDVKELLDRLRRESPALATHHGDDGDES